MAEIRKYVYDDHNLITFGLGEGGLQINATEMAKTFGKLPADYLRLASTKDFLAAYIEVNPVMGNPITVVQGGLNQGTWMNEDIALDFAQWLSPKFKVWVNSKIKELLTTGKTELPQSEDQIILQSLTILQSRLQSANEQLQLANTTIQAQAPKVAYHDQVLQSTTLLKVDLIASQLGMSAAKLNKLLVEKHIQFKRGDTFYLHSELRDKGLADYRTHTYYNTAGEQCTKQHMYWTEAGRQFLLNKMQFPI